MESGFCFEVTFLKKQHPQIQTLGPHYNQQNQIVPIVSALVRCKTQKGRAN